MSKSKFQIKRVAKDCNPALYDIFNEHRRLGLQIKRERAKELVALMEEKGYTLETVDELLLFYYSQSVAPSIEDFILQTEAMTKIRQTILNKNIVG